MPYCEVSWIGRLDAPFRPALILRQAQRRRLWATTRSRGPAGVLLDRRRRRKRDADLAPTQQLAVARLDRPLSILQFSASLGIATHCRRRVLDEGKVAMLAFGRARVVEWEVERSDRGDFAEDLAQNKAVAFSSTYGDD